MTHCFRTSECSVQNKNNSFLEVSENYSIKASYSQTLIFKSAKNCHKIENAPKLALHSLLDDNISRYEILLSVTGLKTILAAILVIAIEGFKLVIDYKPIL